MAQVKSTGQISTNVVWNGTAATEAARNGITSEVVRAVTIAIVAAATRVTLCGHAATGALHVKVLINANIIGATATSGIAVGTETAETTVHNGAHIIKWTQCLMSVPGRVEVLATRMSVIQKIMLARKSIRVVVAAADIDRLCHAQRLH